MGELIIVGAGLGGQSITLAGIEAIRNAEIVLYDRLIHPNIQQHITCESRDVGKRPYRAHCTTQAQINAMIVAELEQGKRVVRLKGGDTSVFARTIEEVEAARSAGAHIIIIPGVTSASSLAARVQSALTDRRSVPGVVFITGHTKADTLETSYRWDALCALGFTIVVYMGVKNMPIIRQQLLTHGMAPNTSVLIGQSLETPQERVFTTTLDDVLTCISTQNISHPATIIIGDVAALAKV
ncbi:uroporphyrinogen-III C-methyltransferase [Desulfurispira natronophila]|uniref:uroporphyrinogen-III C-methyltransferase n=1 Tax=Desulfurispira natronophila TaxID=682562 RepID=A0A7W7Y5Y0_9BACT|nr:uroporphyrinogen-III C-methyltransferase [Desulfurispira natronophila]MBB5022524.1 uroporphyrin-III C-methyltransferase [Desulfurispira natronophila]